MATVEIDIASMTANDRLRVIIGTTVGGSDVFDQTYSSTGFNQHLNVTTLAATQWIDLLAWDTLTDAHDVRVNTVSYTDPIERITNSQFTANIDGWTQVVATIAWNSGNMDMTGFGGPGSPTTARQSFNPLFTAEAAAAAENTGGCLEWLGYELAMRMQEAETLAAQQKAIRDLANEARAREAEFARKYAAEIDAYMTEVERLDNLAGVPHFDCEIVKAPTGRNVMESRPIRPRNALRTQLNIRRR